MWAADCPEKELWAMCVSLLSGQSEVNVSSVPAVKKNSAKKSLNFASSSSTMSLEEKVAIVSTALRRCAVRGSPMNVLEMCCRHMDRPLNKACLQQWSSITSLFPSFWSERYKVETSSSSSSPPSSPAASLFMTPTKKILVSGGTGGQGKGGLHVSSSSVSMTSSAQHVNRERLRDSLCGLFSSSSGDDVRMVCNKLLEQMRSDNGPWLCDALLDNYLRYCNRTSDTAEEMLMMSHSSHHAVDVVYIRHVVDAMFNQHVWLYHCMLGKVITRLQHWAGPEHIATDCYFVCMQIAHLALWLAIVTFSPMIAPQQQGQQGSRIVADVVKSYVPPYSLLSLLSSSSIQQQRDARSTMLTCVMLEAYTDALPPQMQSAPFVETSLVPFVRMIRRQVQRMRCLTELFIFAKCNGVLSNVGFDAGSNQQDNDQDNNDDDDDDDDAFYRELDEHVRHPLFVKNVLMRGVEEELPRVDSRRPSRWNSMNMQENSSSSSSSEGKYWFFKLHHSLLPIVNCVSKCVANNAMLKSLHDAHDLPEDMTDSDHMFDICIVKCESLIRLQCPDLVKLLASPEVEDAVLKRASMYCEEASLQICYDALPDPITELCEARQKKLSKKTPTKDDSSSSPSTSTSTSTSTSVSNVFRSSSSVGSPFVSPFCTSTSTSTSNVYSLDLCEEAFIALQHDQWSQWIHHRNIPKQMEQKLLNLLKK